MSKIKILKNVNLLIILLITVTVLSGCFFGTPVVKTVTPTIRAIGVPDGTDVGSVSLTVTDADGIVIADETYTTLPSEIKLSIPAHTYKNSDFSINYTKQMLSSQIQMLSA